MQLAVTLLWSAAVGTSGLARREPQTSRLLGGGAPGGGARLRVCVCETLVSHGHESGPQISGCKAITAWGWTVAPKRYVHI